MIGTDIIEIRRIAKAMENKRFIDRVYTPAERQYIMSKPDPAESAAGIFAAKEAALKALRCGITKCVTFACIAVCHDKNGAPSLQLSGAAAQILESLGKSRAEISISHCKEYAVAFCMLV